MKKHKFKNVIIIGAPRSGTNMLRDVLCSIEGFDTWPCDEINFIWRHGNIKSQSDELRTDQANDYVKKFIRDKFCRLQKKKNSKVIVEKTCANSLRVPFVNEIIPDAKFIYIKRDMLDVVGSAKHRWKAPISYLFTKKHNLCLFLICHIMHLSLSYQEFIFFSNEKELLSGGLPQRTCTTT